MWWHSRTGGIVNETSKIKQENVTNLCLICKGAKRSIKYHPPRYKFIENPVWCIKPRRKQNKRRWRILKQINIRFHHARREKSLQRSKKKSFCFLICLIDITCKASSEKSHYNTNFTWYNWVSLSPQKEYNQKPGDRSTDPLFPL